MSSKTKYYKNLWLDKYYPNITERILTFENIPKYESILAYCKNKNISLKDCIFIDDVLAHLRKAEQMGIKSYHISSFLDWNL